jgi:hypothetical protein
MGLGLKRAPLSLGENAIRRHYRAWHKYATGLAGHITDPDWRAYAEANIRGHEATTWMSIYVGTVAGYGAGLPLGHELYAPVPTSQPPPGPPPPLWQCSPGQQKGSVEVEMLKIPGQAMGGGPRPDFSASVEINCDKVSVEADGMVTLGVPSAGGAPPFGVGLGGFLQASKSRTGEITLFGGPKATASAGGVKGILQDGVYLTTDARGRLKEVGGRVSGSQQAGGLKLQADEMDFVIWKAPPRQEIFNPKYGLNVWQNINPPLPP